jgi:hypothetical protein
MNKLLMATFILFMGFSPIVSFAGQTIPQYGVVYGADTVMEDSNTEVARFNNNTKFPKYNGKSAMFLRNNVYRSVLLFNRKEEARNAQREVEIYLNNIDRMGFARNNPNWVRGSYVVNLSLWCPNWNTNQKTQGTIKYYICQSR